MIALGFMATTVRAQSPHFLKGPTANFDTTNGDLCISFKEAGLGSTPVTYTITADNETFTFQCYTKSNNTPQGSPNSVSDSNVSVPTTLTPHNGQISSSLCLVPDQDGASCQGHGLVLKLTAASYTNVQFCDSGTGGCVSLGSFSFGP
jgi:hypothetical protein